MKTSSKLLITGLIPIFFVVIVFVIGTTMAVTAKNSNPMEQPRDTIRIETIKIIHDTVWLPRQCNPPDLRPHVGPQVQPQVQPIRVDTQVLNTNTETVNP